MEQDRKRYRMSAAGWRRQAGITAVGFLGLAAVFGVVGLGLIRVLPLYMEKFRLATVLEDVRQETDGAGQSVAGIRNTLTNHLIVEGIQIPREDIQITATSGGHVLRVYKESRASYIADLSLLVVFDEQVEIRR